MVNEEEIRQHRQGKAPGIDGFPVEFYRTFWHCLAEDFQAVANEDFCMGELSPT
jgi:hypothetical protein